MPLLDVFRSVLLLFAHRLRSLNAMEEILRRRGRPLVGRVVPSADTMAFAYDRLDSQGLRDMIAEICRKAWRSKALRPRGKRRWRVIALDGHELFASYKRCCDACSKRRVETTDGPKTQYFHRIVAAHLVDVEPPVCVDAEPIQPGEGEPAAARRLIERVAKSFPWIDIYTLDAIYLEQPTVRQLVGLGKIGIVTLKQEARDLHQEARLLLREKPCTEERLEGDRLQLWDLPDIRAWEGMNDIPVRVVRSIRHRTVRERIARKWVEHAEAQDWMWAVAGPSQHLSALDIHFLGHGRWDIENCGFNEMDRFFGLDHCFKHAPKAILNFILTLFLGSFLTELFFTRNIKRPDCRRHTLLGLARLLLESPPSPDGRTLWSLARSP